MAEYMIGARRFDSKKGAENEVSRLLGDTPKGTALRGAELQLMADLLVMHPQAAKKIGPGISTILVRGNPWGGKTFYVLRTDGSETDFSFHMCFQGERADRLSFRAACRYAVLPYVREARSRFFEMAEQPTCPLTGAPLTIDTCHIDHAPPYTFDRIYRAFLVLNDIDENDSSLCRHADNEIDPLFADPVLRDRWVAFHHGLAQLRAISADANTRLVKNFVRRNGNGNGR